MPTPHRPTHLRDAPSLWPLRGRRPVVVVCLDEPGAHEAARAEFARLGAELVVERRPGPLSERVGRPAVVVCDRYLEVIAADARMGPDAVLEALEWADARCEECPQAAQELPELAEGWRR